MSSSASCVRRGYHRLSGTRTRHPLASRSPSQIATSRNAAAGCGPACLAAGPGAAAALAAAALTSALAVARFAAAWARAAGALRGTDAWGRARADPDSRAALRATAAALRDATGINAEDPVWGAPFREMSTLFLGEPPVEALGVSAKFHADGSAKTARYHVFLQLPCPKWALPRGAMEAACLHACVGVAIFDGCWRRRGGMARGCLGVNHPPHDYEAM